MNNDIIDTKIIDLFLQSFSSVFKSFFSINLKRGNMSFLEEPFEDSEVAIITGVTGENHEGVIAYSMSEITARILVEKVEMEDELSSYGEILFDVLGEWMNILAGNVTRDLNEKGFSLYITPPSIVLGNDFTLKLIRQIPLLVEMQSSIGSIGVNFAVKKVVNKDITINVSI